ncbi:DUF6188 family protein [Kitasatospora sp. NPDC004669]|uniref:DUF6188 family protein n=1 Tax=Kitasatospora sp. NPDC004669 TaxID=3154555 RepID=UPI0033ABBFF8
MTNEMSELADRWILPLRGHRVVDIAWGDDVRFVLEPSGEVIVGCGALWTEGPVTAPGARPATLDQCEKGQIQQATGASILSAVGFKSGALRVVFSNGWHLNVKSEGPFVPASVKSSGTVIWERPRP